MTDTDFATRFRPRTFDDVVGQDAAVASLRDVIESGKKRSFVMIGPSGTGKTTLARILASEVGADPKNIDEVNAASNTGVDAMRAVMETLRYKPMGGKSKVIIIDECHMLSKAAWNSLLKDVEEPPAFAYWCFLTTEPEKIPQTIRTRCVTVNLKSVAEDELYTLLESVREEMKGEVSDAILDVVAESAGGSPRQALTSLAAVWSCEETEDAISILESATRSSDVIELSRLMSKGNTNWRSYAKILDNLKETNPESIRLQVLAYFAKVALGAKSFDAAIPALAVLDAFSKPYGHVTGMAPILLSLGQLLGEDE
tara:strand:+ start:11007 stop:11945 length:939 start_codon:yes stop_codon:yes gene_type:complete